MRFPQKCLASLGTIHTGSTPSTSDEQYWGGEIPFVTPSELDQRLPVLKTPRTLTAEGGSQSRLIREGSVMVCCIGSLGKIGIAGRTLATNQQINSIEFDSQQVWPKFGYYACQKLKPKLVTMAPATTIAIVSKSKFAQLEIPVPPLPAQRRIAAILDQADALRAKRREALAQLDSLTQSIFIEMFGDPVSNPKGWPDTTTLGEVANIASGVTKGRNLISKVTRTVPYLAVANVQDKSLNLSGVKDIEATEDEIQRYQLKRDDLLLTEGGDPDKLGRGTLWKNELPECIHQNHIFRVRLTSEAVTPLFLNWLVGSQRGKKFFLRSAKQTTGIASINMTQLRSFPLLLPPIEVQRNFEKIALGIAEQHAIHTTSLTEIDTLFGSLQHRAFQGEL
jgi:type I restriction enzyme, S subunit